MGGRLRWEGIRRANAQRDQGIANRRDPYEISDWDFLTQIAKAKAMGTGWPAIPPSLNLIARVQIDQHVEGVRGWYQSHPWRTKVEKLNPKKKASKRRPRRSADPEA